jgi:hypothetical protein
MGNLVVLFIHLIATMARLLGPGGVRSIVAESLLLKHQLVDQTLLLRQQFRVEFPDLLIAAFLFRRVGRLCL